VAGDGRVRSSSGSARSIWPAWVRLVRQNIASSQPMLAILHSLNVIADLFKSRCRLETENLFLRHQLSIALRHVTSSSTARR
jgi:hypothetical protein